jgi:hypothetical protein
MAVCAYCDTPVCMMDWSKQHDERVGIFIAPLPCSAAMEQKRLSFRKNTSFISGSGQSELQFHFLFHVDILTLMFHFTSI